MDEQIEVVAVGKAARRLVPLLAVMYFVSFLDRVNVGFAALTMNTDLGLTPSGYGMGAGIFFAGYIAFAVPANMLLRRYGASRWIGAIACVWGCLSLSMAFISTPSEFYVMRFCLGVAESGFLPGVILYLTSWFPPQVQGRVVASFFVAVPLSNVLGAPISGLLLETHLFALRGWQLLFLLEALPAIMLGLLALRHLPDSPEQASWLTGEERRAMVSAARRATAVPATGGTGVLIDPRVWGLGMVYFLIVLALYGFAFWAPQIFHSLGSLTPLQVGFLTAVPYLGASLAMVFWSRHSDRRSERIWHLTLPCLLGAIGFVAAAEIHTLSGITCAFLLATCGVYAACGVFWTLPPLFLSDAAAAAGIAMINSLGNVAGYAGPYLMGWLRTSTGGYAAGILTMAASMACGALVALTVGLHIRHRWNAQGRRSSSI